MHLIAALLSLSMVTSTPLETYEPDATATVVAKKAVIYDTAKRGGRTSAYLVKNDHIVVIGYAGGFIQFNLTNPKQVTTAGYLRASDVRCNVGLRAVVKSGRTALHQSENGRARFPFIVGGDRVGVVLAGTDRLLVRYRSKKDVTTLGWIDKDRVKYP